MEINQCPQSMVTPDIWEIIQAADWASKGAWYMPGGWGDQTVACIEGVRFVLAERNRWEAQLTKSKNG